MAGERSYPVQVLYCNVCSLPAEYCKFGPIYEKCKPWLREHALHLHPELAEGEAGGDAPPAAAASSSTAGQQGGKGKKKKNKDAPCVTIKRNQRNKRKWVTEIAGLELFGVKLAEAAKLFSKKFSCGASVVKEKNLTEQIDIQGDVRDDLVTLILKTWPDKVEPAIVFFLEDGKKVPALSEDD